VAELATPATTYDPDAALEDPKKDRFDRFPFARRIAETIITRADPSSLVIGLYGAWGDGKTTLLNFVKHELDCADRIVCFRFNPWRFSDEDALLRAFFDQMATAVQAPRRTAKQRGGNIISGIGSLMPKISTKWLSMNPALEGPSLEIDLGERIREFGANLSSSALEEDKRRIGEELGKRAVRVVVLLDDIDRLEDTEIHALFRLVKLTADFPNTVYVLAFDPRFVAKALRARYSSAPDETGFGYLEKIVQVPLTLPAAEPSALRQFVLQAVDRAVDASRIELSDAQVQEFVEGFEAGLRSRFQTPRAANRYGNLLLFALPLLRGEVNPVDQMLVEGIHVVHPRMYDVIRAHPSIFLKGAGGFLSKLAGESDKAQKDRIAETIIPGLEGLAPRDQQGLRDLLVKLFPKLKTIFENVTFGDGFDERWAAEQRIASEEYFARYFSYAVPRGDIPDAEIRKLVDQAGELSVGEIVVAMHALMGDRGADTLLDKLFRETITVSPIRAARLAAAVARVGSTLPDPPGNFGVTPFRRSAALTGRFLAKLPPGEERIESTTGLLAEVEPPTFAVEIVNTLPVEKELPADDQLDRFTKVEQEAIKASIAGMVQARFKGDMSALKMLENGYFLLTVWAAWGDSTQVQEYTTAAMSADPEVAFVLLEGGAMHWRSVNTGQVNARFEPQSYDSLTRVADPAAVYEAVGGSVPGGSQASDHASQLRARLSDEFRTIHETRRDRNPQL
jgi:hypothetical protein